jgi:hypothetical protein
MALGQIKVNGKASFTTVYGYQPLVIKVANTGAFTATTGGHQSDDTTSQLVFGGYEHAMLTVMQFASIVFMGAQDPDHFTVVVDGASCNLAGLTAAFAAQGGTVTTASVLNGDGTFTFA